MNHTLCCEIAGHKGTYIHTSTRKAYLHKTYCSIQFLLVGSYSLASTLHTTRATCKHNVHLIEKVVVFVKLEFGDDYSQQCLQVSSVIVRQIGVALHVREM